MSAVGVDTSVLVRVAKPSDARLASSYAAAGCDRLLTLDPRDFAGATGTTRIIFVSYP